MVLIENAAISRRPGGGMSVLIPADAKTARLERRCVHAAATRRAVKLAHEWNQNVGVPGREPSARRAVCAGREPLGRSSVRARAVPAVLGVTCRKRQGKSGLSGGERAAAFIFVIGITVLRSP
jgi:hypothetical protein